MIVFKENLEGDCLWVEGERLHQFTDDGWRIVAMADEDTHEEYQATEEGEYGLQYKMKSRPVRKVSFLIHRGRDKVLEDLRERVRTAEEESRKKHKEWFEAKALTGEMEKAHAETQEKLDKSLKNARYLGEDLERAGETNRKLERHLSIVRKELGEAKWRELVGEKEE